ncbi:MAG TPA: hypothetical protein VG498_05695 [Terriglobales bacterium]|nr:hypothetical protein [Terriglobales bacterium]
MVRAVAVMSAVLACALFLPADLHAQQDSTSQIDPQTVKALLQRIQELENRVHALEAAQQQASQPPAAASAAQNAPAGQQPTPVAASMTEMSDMSGHVVPGSGERMRIRGFSDIDYRSSSLKGSTNSFALGQFNLFITSKLAGKTSVLAETVVEADQGTNEFGIELERLLLQYNASERLNLSFGRYHTHIGYYNTEYHHSAWMQTTMGRPFLYQFEDNGGILPIHNVGISATGLVNGKLGLEYIAEVGNGRSARINISNPVQNVTDENNGKSFNVGFVARPEALSGWELGFTAYHDNVSPLNVSPVNENIFSGHLIYTNSRFEFLNEGVMLSHSPQGSPFTIHTPGFYSQLSKRFGNYRPYFRYEYVNVPQRDPLYSDVGRQEGPTIGLRYNINEFTAYKLEYGRTIRRNLSSTNNLGMQLAFAF